MLQTVMKNLTREKIKKKFIVSEKSEQKKIGFIFGRKKNTIT